KEDIPLLVEFFLRKYSEENQRQGRRITPECLRPLLNYAWPGNVRELENVIERAVVLSSGSDIGPELLPDHIVGRGTPVALIAKSWLPSAIFLSDAWNSFLPQISLKRRSSRSRNMPCSRHARSVTCSSGRSILPT